MCNIDVSKIFVCNILLTSVFVVNKHLVCFVLLPTWQRKHGKISKSHAVCWEGRISKNNMLVTTQGVYHIILDCWCIIASLCVGPTDVTTPVVCESVRGV